MASLQDSGVFYLHLCFDTCQSQCYSTALTVFP
nr:MAG TPA: hypothetical protein [Caudoviricetes sp.]